MVTDKQSRTRVRVEIMSAGGSACGRRVKVVVRTKPTDNFAHNEIEFDKDGKVSFFILLEHSKVSHAHVTPVVPLTHISCIYSHFTIAKIVFVIIIDRKHSSWKE